MGDFSSVKLVPKFSCVRLDRSICLVMNLVMAESLLSILKDFENGELGEHEFALLRRLEALVGGSNPEGR